MHEFDGGRRADVTAAGIPAQFGGGQSQHRAQSFAAAVDQMMRKLRDHVDVGHRLVEDDPVDLLQVVGDEIKKRLEALLSLAHFIKRYDASHAEPQNCAEVCATISPPAPFVTTPLALFMTPTIKAQMRDLLATNDPVVMSYATSLLKGEGIDAVVLDQNVSAVEGEIGALSVKDEDWTRARRVLTEADLGAWLRDE